MVITKDRGRFGVVLNGHAPDDVLTCMRSRELGRTPLVVGDQVAVVGDLSGNPGSLARIVAVDERATVLRRTADDSDTFERVVVANADILLIVAAVADPPPRAGFVERALVAAYAGGLRPVLALTKSDLADPSEFTAEFAALDLQVLEVGVDDDLTAVTELISDRVSALIGHSGVGKSTLVNRLVPGAGRATGVVSGVGKGRHTSTQSVALPLPQGGWIVDTPGVRSFGLAHISPDTLVHAFEDLAAATEDCPRGCSHLGPPADPECGLDALAAAEPDSPTARRVVAVRQLLVALKKNVDWELDFERESI